MLPILSHIRVGPVSVAVRTDEPTLLGYLAEFYEISDDPPGAASWTVDAAVGSTVGLPPPNGWGVAHRADPASRVVVVRADTANSLAISSRKLIREALVEYCEQHRYTMLHASAFVDDGSVVMIVGDKGSGKTTLALRSILDHGYRYVSNDHLILFAQPGAGPLSARLTLTSLPTLLPVKVGTYLDLEDRLPEPWDDESVDLAPFRAMPPADRYAYSHVRVMFTYRGLGQENPVEVRLGSVDSGPRLLVVLAAYAPADLTVGAPWGVDEPEMALWPHVRFDWAFDPELNTQHLQRVQRNPHDYGTDARRLLAALADRAEVVSWTHHGDPGPLLDALDDGQRRPCAR